MRISHWRSDVCSLDLYRRRRRRTRRIGPAAVSGCRSPAPPLRTRPGTERLRLKNSLNSIRAAAMGRPVQEHSMTEPREIIDFWFGAPGSDAYGVFRDVWFERDGAFDAAIRAGFLDAFEAAAAGTLTGWRDAPESCLALILQIGRAHV